MQNLAWNSWRTDQPKHPRLMKRSRWSREPPNVPWESLLPCECLEVASQLHHYPFNPSAHVVWHQLSTEYWAIETKYNFDVEREVGMKKNEGKMSKWMNEKKYNCLMFRFCFLVSGVTNSQVQWSGN